MIVGLPACDSGNARAAAMLPTLFSRTASSPTESYEIPNEIVWSAVAAGNPVRLFYGGSVSQLVSPSIVDLKPASVLAWTFCCHCSQRRSMLQW